MRRSNRRAPARAGIAGTYVLCATASFALLTALCSVGQRDESTPPVHSPTQELSTGEVTFALQPYGAIPDALLQRHAALLRERFRARVEIQPPRRLPPSAFDSQRGQYVATALLDDLYVHRPASVTHAVGVVSVDLYADGWDFLYGFSQVEGRVAVYSLARLQNRQQRGADWVFRGLERAEKVMLHEVGHTFDIGHCDHPHCVMNTVDTRPGLDHLSRFFCRRCAQRVRTPLPREPEADAVARGDGLFRRGAFERAWVRYATELMRRPTNPQLLNRVGLAAAASRSPVVAELAYRLAIARDPEFALPYYNFGLLLAALDPQRAALLFQIGFAHDPDRVEALGFLGTVYLEVIGDEHRALWFFQRYVGEGGSDPGVLYRYEQLLRPEIVVFSTREVPVIEAGAENGPSPAR